MLASVIHKLAPSGESRDKFDAPAGPEPYTRRMRLIPVQDDHIFGDKVREGILRDVVLKMCVVSSLCSNFLTDVRSKIVCLLNEKDVKPPAVDFV